MTTGKPFNASTLEMEHVETLSIATKNDKDMDSEPIEPKGDYSGATKKTDPLEIKLVRKLDRRILPILWAMYFLNYLDRNALPQARLNTLEADLNLKGVEYNTAISILFVGYILMQGTTSSTLPSPHSC